MLFKYSSFFCPVCDEHLGQHPKNQITVLHCDECRARFVWKPGEQKPKAMLDEDVPEKCGCGCGR